MTDHAVRPETLREIRRLQTRVEILEKRLLKRGFEAAPTREFSLVTASEAPGTYAQGNGSFLSTPWVPHAQEITVVGLWAGFGSPDGFVDTSVELLRNGISESSVLVVAGAFSGQSACGVTFSTSDTLTFSVPDSGGLWQLLTVYAVVSTPGQSAGLDFLFSPRPL